MLERSRQALKASMLLLLSSPLLATTFAVYEQRERSLCAIAEFAHGGPSPEYVLAQTRTAWRDAESHQWAISPFSIE